MQYMEVKFCLNSYKNTVLLYVKQISKTYICVVSRVSIMTPSNLIKLSVYTKRANCLGKRNQMDVLHLNTSSKYVVCL